MTEFKRLWFHSCRAKNSTFQIQNPYFKTWLPNIFITWRTHFAIWCYTHSTFLHNLLHWWLAISVFQQKYIFNIQRNRKCWAAKELHRNFRAPFEFWDVQICSWHLKALNWNISIWILEEFLIYPKWPTSPCFSSTVQ